MAKPIKKKISVTLFEGKILLAMFGFQKKIRKLIRQSKLSDEQAQTAASRMKTLLDALMTDVKRTQRFDIRERLDATYNEMKQFVARMSKASDGGTDGSNVADKR